MGGDLFSVTYLDAAAATTLAGSANDIVPSNITSACLFGQQSARYTRTSGELINGVGTGSSPNWMPMHHPHRYLRISD